MYRDTQMRRSYTHHYTAHPTCSSAQQLHTTAARHCPSATKPTSSVQRSHSAHATLAPRCCSRCRLSLYSSGDTATMWQTSAQHGLPATAAAAANNRVTHHGSPTAKRRYCTRVRSSAARTNTRNQPQTIAHSAAQSQSSNSETRCSNAHATTPNPPSQYCGTAP
jgi:hypothetical protein